MPQVRLPISVSQLCDLLAIDPVQFRGIEAPRARVTAEGGLLYEGSLHIVVEVPDANHRHLSAERHGHEEGRQ